MSLSVIFLCLPRSKSTKSFGEALRCLDFGGIGTMATATVLVLLAFEWASDRNPWSSPQVITCLVLGVVFVGLFIFAESRARRPVIPLRFFTHRTRVGAYTAAFFHAISYSGLNYYAPIYFQGVRDQSASESGVSMLPLVLAFALVSTGSGYLITATKR